MPDESSTNVPLDTDQDVNNINVSSDLTLRQSPSSIDFFGVDLSFGDNRAAYGLLVNEESGDGLYVGATFTGGFTDIHPEAFVQMALPSDSTNFSHDLQIGLMNYVGYDFNLDSISVPPILESDNFREVETGLYGLRHNAHIQLDNESSLSTQLLVATDFNSEEVVSGRVTGQTPISDSLLLEGGVEASYFAGESQLGAGFMVSQDMSGLLSLPSNFSAGGQYSLNLTDPEQSYGAAFAELDVQWGNQGFASNLSSLFRVSTGLDDDFNIDGVTLSTGLMTEVGPMRFGPRLDYNLENNESRIALEGRIPF